MTIACVAMAAMGWMAMAGAATAPPAPAAPAPSQSSPAPARLTAAPGVRLGGDYFARGTVMALPPSVPGDALVLARVLRSDGRIGGDLVAFADRQRIGGSVGHTAYLAAAVLQLQGRIAGNARLIGRQVTLAPGASIQGGTTIAAREVSLDGTIGSYVAVVAEVVRIDGHVNGEALIAARRLQIGPHAVIEGALRYSPGAALQIARSAQIHQGIAPLPHVSAQRSGSPPYVTLLRLGGWLWLLGWLLVGALALAMWPQFTATVSQRIRTRPGVCLLVGLAVVISVPVCVALLIISVLGLPLAALLILLYLLVLPLGYLSAVASLGDWVLLRLPALRARAAREALPSLWRFGAFIVTLMVLYLLRRVPILGPALQIWVLLTGVGGLVFASLSQLRTPPTAPELLAADVPGAAAL